MNGNRLVRGLDCVAGGPEPAVRATCCEEVLGGGGSICKAE